MGTRTAQAQRVGESPVIDGELSDAVWEGSSMVSNFSQRNPREGEPATERTEVRIIYNDQAIFFGIICYDSEPDGIIATERARDGGSSGGGFHAAFRAMIPLKSFWTLFTLIRTAFFFAPIPWGPSLTPGLPMKGV